jgi:hypothetical protein
VRISLLRSWDFMLILSSEREKYVQGNVKIIPYIDIVTSFSKGFLQNSASAIGADVSLLQI